jgi:hypothetical protein
VPIKRRNCFGWIASPTFEVAEGDHLWGGLSAIDQMISPLPARHALLMNLRLTQLANDKLSKRFARLTQLQADTTTATPFPVAANYPSDLSARNNKAKAS